MAYIFMDESGDLGFDFTKKCSKYFIVTFLFSEEKKPLEKIIKKIFSWLSKKSIKVSWWVLHCTKEKPETRKKLYSLCLNWDMVIMAIYLKKSKVYSHLHNQKHILYNYIVNILLDRIITKHFFLKQNKIDFIASRRETNKIINENFLWYLTNKTKFHKIDINFFIKTPNQEKWLQIVDFMSWAIYQKYENQNEYYYHQIKKIIIEEKSLFS